MLNDNKMIKQIKKQEKIMKEIKQGVQIMIKGVQEVEKKVKLGLKGGSAHVGPS